MKWKDLGFPGYIELWKTKSTRRKQGLIESRKIIGSFLLWINIGKVIPGKGEIAYVPISVPKELE